MPATLHLEDVAPGVRALTLSNPTRSNALDEGFLDALAAAVATRDEVRAWLVRSDTPRVFSAGYDLNALNGFPEGTPLPDTKLGVVLDALAAHPAPSVALVRGAAVGAGCELAAACDFRVGDATARFSLPPAKLGVVYALDGLRRVARVVGVQRAKHLFLAAESLDAQAALQAGLLDVLADDAEARALELCTRLASLAPLAVRGMKRGFGLLEGASPDALADYERVRRESFNSADAQEGRAALFEKRPPRFEGR